MKKNKAVKAALILLALAVLLGSLVLPVPLSSPKVMAQGGCYEVQLQPLPSNDIMVIIIFHEADGSTSSKKEPINPDYVEGYIAQMTVGYTPCSINTQSDSSEAERQYLTDDTGSGVTWGNHSGGSSNSGGGYTAIPGQSKPGGNQNPPKPTAPKYTQPPQKQQPPAPTQPPVVSPPPANGTPDGQPPHSSQNKPPMTNTNSVPNPDPDAGQVEGTFEPALDSSSMEIPKGIEEIKDVNADYINGIAWDAAYDVIICGIDASAVAAAVTAVEEDAQSILMLDPQKAEDVGGVTRYCAQNILYTENADEAFKYLKALQGQFTTLEDDFIDTLSKGAYSVPGWFVEHGLADLYRLSGGVNYAKLPGGDSMKLFRLTEDTSYDSSAWKFLEELLAKFNDFIDYSYETKLVKLIQEPSSKAVIGVEIERGGESYKIRANRGVILSSEGFEANETMVEDFLQVPYARPMHPVQNDGYGIKAAMGIGADLWHMGNIAGYELQAADAGEETDMRMLIQGKNDGQLGTRSCFIVGENGMRFTNEAKRPRMGHMDPAGRWIAQEMPRRAWVVFDEAGLTSAPLYPGWSADNMQEVDKGIIKKYNSLEEMAKDCNMLPEALLQQLYDYNSFCQQGYDPQEGRHPDRLFALNESGPFYALPLVPVIHHTLGGPKRNNAGEVISVRGEVIPGLYSAGLIGSAFSDVVPSGAELMESVISGRIAGTNAAAVKKDLPITELPETKFTP